jgi:hypothetical protein
MNTQFQTILSSFKPIHLFEMERVKLLNRVDKKYLMHMSQLSHFLTSLSEDYDILEHNEKRMLRYETAYYDTPELDFYRMHLVGKAHRFKVRKRIYLDTATQFLEIKTKTNQGKTEKLRLQMEEDREHFNELERTLIQSIVPFAPSQLALMIWTNYSRITLVNKSLNERVTIDVSLQFFGKNSNVDFTNLVIVEVKQEGKVITPAVKTLRELRQKPGGISKYCLGMLSLMPEIPSNRFKPLLIRIKKLIHPPQNQYFTANA